jgi:ArsR family transcriptional regulator
MNARKCQPALAEERAAAMLAALGSTVRLKVYRLLLRAGGEGISVTTLQRSSGIPASTLNHHLAALVAAGLVSQERVGRELICRAEYSDIQRLSGFLLQECCADAPVGVIRMLGINN